MRPGHVRDDPMEKRKFGVPLSQLESVKACMETKEAVEDWRYWVIMRYEF